MIHVGDCLEVMRTLEASSVDAIVTDPPYGLGFMGKAWDHGVPGEPFWVEALRVAKPGAHIVAFGGTRTFHRLACALEDAGWEIRDTLMWVYGSGFPKSLDVSKAIDKAAGHWRGKAGDTVSANGAMSGGNYERSEKVDPITAAAAWHGWGTALKPAWEPITLARKPLIGTVADNVQAHGTGALNIDSCRVGMSEQDASRIEGMGGFGRAGYIRQKTDETFMQGTPESSASVAHADGRWPANFVHDGSDEVVSLFPDYKAVVQSRQKGSGGIWSGVSNHPCGPQYGDNGSAARFFYCAKANRSDRDDGCDHIAQTMVHGPSGDGRCWDIPGSKSEPKSNNHPTVKPTDLMRWLCRLVTPPGGLILDPFAGSGSTGRGAILEGFRFVGIELSEEYAAIAEARIATAVEQRRIDTAQLEMFVGSA